MAKKKKPKVGALGPQPYWLRMSLTERERTKQYIKESFNGYVRADGVAVPSLRRVYSGFDATHGYDLRHIERWPAAKLKSARNRIESLNTFTGRPFAVVTPHTKGQRRAVQNFTGQTLASQKAFIVPVQDPKRDEIHFKKGKIAVERKFPGGTKTLKQRFLFVDYMREQPQTFRQMRAVTKQMMKDMPKNVYGQPAFYTMLTRQYGPIGNSSSHARIPDLLEMYFNKYDKGGGFYKGHEAFAEQVIGYQMIGTKAQYTAFELETNRLRELRKQRRKLRFYKPLRCNVMNKKDKRCKRVARHPGKHKF